VPGLGQQLLYRLSTLDVDQIQNWRSQALAAALAAPVFTPVPGGAEVHEGDICVAIVVRCRSLDPDDGVNLRVLLDGNHDLWAERRTEGDTPGTWHWPDI
jgi:hypothetical protein